MLSKAPRHVGLAFLIAPGLLLTLFTIFAERLGLGGAPGFGRGEFVAFAAGTAMVAGAVLLHKKALNDLNSRGRPYHKTVVFVVLPFVTGLCAATFLADRSLGILYPEIKVEPNHFMLPPFSDVTIGTSEFTFKVETNSLGMRDREVSAGERRPIRIVAIGDSFTYGWGVNAEDSWPKLLEAKLHDAGYDLEVLNVGRPGVGVDGYADTAARMLPMLTPDLVLVGVLQGDDLASPLRVRGGGRRSGYKVLASAPIISAKPYARLH